MTDSSQLPHLLRLLDDDSVEVRRAVAREFSSFGPRLRSQLDSLASPPDEGQWDRILRLINEERVRALREDWDSWRDLNNDLDRLEAAQAALARFVDPRPESAPLPLLLDSLADEFRRSRRSPDFRSLSEFLFQQKRLRGAPTEDYYRPVNSSLAYAIENRRGLPISLVCVYILVGRRLDVRVEGCNFPGHFLARVREKDRILLVDCFHGGRFFEDRDILKTHSGPARSLRELIHARTDAETIVRRVLRNLVGAYEKSRESENREIVAELLSDLEA